MRLSSIARARQSPLAVPSYPPQARMQSFPAPTRGWNARDALPEMEPSDAIVLDNYFPTTSDVRLRNGSVDHATGMTGAVETLMPYSAGSTEELWAMASGSLYDVTSSGAVGAAAVTGLTNSRWQFVNFSTSGNHFIVAVNGSDHAYIYDGTTWQEVTAISTPYAITGVDTSTLTSVFAFKHRLFFLEQNSLEFWYLPVDEVAGAATAFDLGPEFIRGGYIMAGGSWTRDGGDGMDDLFVCITNHGECAIYQGTDPSDSTAWSIVGRYDIPSPIGRRCLMGFGSDLLVITIDGVISLGQMLSLDRSKAAEVSVSDRIRNAFTSAASLYSNSFGWEGVSYPAKSMVLFNIPLSENVEQQQYVLNAITGSWCRFKGWDANCFAVFNDLLYFGGDDGTVGLADYSDNDNGDGIEGLIQTAYLQHDNPALNKHYQMVKPLLFSMTGLIYGIGLLTDYDLDTSGISTTSSGIASGSDWDSATWDEASWATEVALKDWRSSPAVGTCVSAVFISSTMGVEIRLNNFSIMYKLGGPL